MSKIFDNLKALQGFQIAIARNKMREQQPAEDEEIRDRLDVWIEEGKLTPEEADRLEESGKVEEWLERHEL